MTRAFKVSAFVAMGILMAGASVSAQTAPATSGGQVTIGALGTSNISSSKFTEYRANPTGMSMPFFSLYSRTGDLDFGLNGYNVSQSDQRYTGWLNTNGLGLKFDLNEIPHNMGNGAHVIFSEASQGVWTASSTLRQTLESTILKTSSSGRTFDFYNTLFTPTLASTNSVDVSGVRKTGNVSLDFGDHLPFDLMVTYKQDFKSGYRGLSGGNWRATLSPVYEVAAPLNEITQDFGVRTEYQFNSGNVYATFNRNIYNNRAETLTIDNLVQWNDSSTGYARNQIVEAPDNQASTGTAGFTLKTKYQTRLSGGIALSQRTQDAPFYTYTLYTLRNTTAGVNASSYAALPRSSFGGKINTQMYNAAFSSRPIEGLTLRARYRYYKLADKSADRSWILGGDMSTGSTSWDGLTASAEDPYGHATANIYDTKSQHYSGSATYTSGPVTIEGSARGARLERTSREATKGSENGWAVTGIFHATDMLGVRATYDEGKRKVTEGETIYGYQVDEAPFTNKKTGIDVELTPTDGLDLSFGYYRRNVEYTDRPDRVQVSGGVPVVGAAPIPNTPSGLLSAKYDSYTGEFNYTASERVELGAYYTYEKDATTNQWSTTTGANLNNLLNYAGMDKTNTWGGNAVFQLVPEKRTLSLNAAYQKVDGLMDVTANTGGSFANGRTTLNLGSGNAADINDWDDTKITTLSAVYDNALNQSWTLSVGYTYQKYDFSDAYNSSPLLMTTSLIFLTKPDNGAYKANMVYARLSHTF